MIPSTHAPFSIKLNKSIPKVEKVVKPPQIPRIQNARKISPLPRLVDHLVSNPIRKAPPRFTSMVASWVWGDSKWARMARKTEPIAPPSPTKSKNCIPIKNKG